MCNSNAAWVKCFFDANIDSEQDNNEEANDFPDNADGCINCKCDDDKNKNDDTSLSSINNSLNDCSNLMANDDHAFDCSHVSSDIMSTSSGSTDLNSVAIDEHPTKKATTFLFQQLSNKAWQNH